MGYSVITADSPVSEETKNHPSIKLCAGPCGRYTRTGRMKATEFPNTVVRGDDTTCQRCLNQARREAGELSQKPNVKEENLAHTLKGLASFMARRREREGARTTPGGLEQFNRTLVR